MRHGTTVTGLLRDGAGRVAGVVRDRTPGGRRAARTGPSRWAPTASAPSSPAAVDAPVERRGGTRARCSTATCRACRAERLRVGVRRRRRRRADPHERRADLRLRRHHPGADAAAAPGRGGGGLRRAARARRARRWPTALRGADAGRADARLGRRARVRPPVWGPGWALVGDAGYFKDPITTHGITDALRDAELLADALLAVLAGRRRGVRAGGLPGDPGPAVRPAVRRSTEEVAAYDWDADRVAAAAAPGELGDERRGRPPRRRCPTVGVARRCAAWSDLTACAPPR